MDSSGAWDEGKFRCELHPFGIGEGTAGAEGSVPCFVLTTFGDPSERIAGQRERYAGWAEAGGAKPFALLTLSVPDWHGDLSPWPAPPIERGGEPFSGNAAETLGAITGGVLPSARERLPAIRRGYAGLIGYSMAGLFALWSAYRTDAFSVIASCSGSLWYPGFIDFMEHTEPNALRGAYLSAGESEEWTRHPVFKHSGNAMRRALDILKASPNVGEASIEWHIGGHTGRVGERLFAALRWMAERA